MFAHQQAGIRPDFICLSKGLTGGTLPLSAVLTTDAVYEAFYDDEVARGFLHSHSYTGNPLACRAALATLEIFEQQDVLARNVALARDDQRSPGAAVAHPARAPRAPARHDLGLGRRNRPCPTSRAATTTMRWRAACCCGRSAARSTRCRPMCWTPKPCIAWRRARWPRWKPHWPKSRSRMSSYFVTGTDTGVGKTLVAAALLHALARRYPRVVGMKPVAAGQVRAGGLGQRRRAGAARGLHRAGAAPNWTTRSCCPIRCRRTSQPSARACASISPSS